MSSAHSEEKYGGFGNPAVFFSSYIFFILKIEVKIHITKLIILKCAVYWHIVLLVHSQYCAVPSILFKERVNF